MATNGSTEPVWAWVLGSGGLLNDVVVNVLSQQGVRVCRDREAPDTAAVVAVLVEPAASDWEAVRAEGLPIVVVVDPDVADDRTVALVLRGADAIVDTDELSATIGPVLDVVAHGGTQLTPSETRAVAELARKTVGEQALALTGREREIIDSIAAGHSVKQTALTLHISAKTVENLQSRLFRKLGVRNRAQAIARAHALGLLSAAT